MADQQQSAELVAELNDLLQLDHDAMQAYTVAIENLDDEGHKTTLRMFRGDHERHISELTQLIRIYGGTPVQMPHIPSGFFKLAVQQVGRAGGDREILLAFKSNERQVRDKYQRHASEQHPPEVDDVIRRAAADEERHYTWATATLERMGVDTQTATGQAEGVFERIHGAAADMVEGVERKVMEQVEKSRRSG